MFDDGNPFGTNQLQAVGILNSLKTGDMWLDMIIAMLIPVVLRIAFGFFAKMDSVLDHEAIIRWMRRRKFKYERFIVYRFRRHGWGGITNLNQESHNTVLHKAITLYLHHKCKLSLPVAHLELTSKESSCYQRYDYDYDSDDEDNSDKTLAGTLSKYEVVQKPPKNKWHPVGSFGSPALAPVELQMYDQEESAGKEGDGQYDCMTTFHLVSSGANAIDSFIDTAYQWYMDQLRKMEDDSRHLYDLKALKHDEEAGDSYMLYNRYRLSDEKTFNTLFFRQKDTLLNLVSHFQYKTGKYGIPGYPHKLGLLLHGPPGSGKTSLIKALAQYTGRSIVSVPLTRITTNSELMDVFFDRKYHIRGEDVPVKLGFKDVIFVMEDVDAASKVVRRRDGKRFDVGGQAAPGATNTETLNVPTPKSTWQILLESNNEDCRELVQKLMEKSTRLKEAALESTMIESMARRMSSIPGIGLVGEGANDEALTALGQEAMESANLAVEAFDVVDRFMGSHARGIKSLLESGAPVSESFVDQLLGLTNDTGDTSVKPVARNNMFPRDISYSKYDERMEADLFDHAEQMLAASSGRDDFGFETSTKINMSSDLKEKEIGPSLLSKPKKDQLNLTGLLNVLDGVVDTPGRILIMTSNHPEMLDPALVRPGRIDKKIMLGYMHSPDVIAMIEHYFQTTMSSEQKDRIEELVNVDQLKSTPAQIEQMTAECDEVDDMIEQFERRVRLFSPRTLATTPASSSSTVSTVA